MKKFLKISLSVVLIAALVVGAGSGFSKYYEKQHEVEILVVPVYELNTQVYETENSLNGNITTSVNQNISLDDEDVVDEVFVKEGQQVKKGDKILSLDMTLQEMEQNINQLSLQNYENALAKVEKRLESLKNGGAIDDENYTEPNVSLPDADSSDDSSSSGDILAAVWRNVPILLADLENLGDVDLESEPTQEPQEPEPTQEPQEPEPTQEPQEPEPTQEPQEPEPTQEPQEPEPTQEPQESEPTQEPQEPEPTQEPQEATSTPIPEETPEIQETQIPEETQAAEVSVIPDEEDTTQEEEYIFEEEGTQEEVSPTPTPTPEPEQEDDGLFMEELVLYTVLDGESKPYKGSGTEEDPFVFLCSAENGGVTAMGSFLNRMAGFQEDGKKRDPKEGYWYKIEFYDKTSLFNDPTDKLLTQETEDDASLDIEDGMDDASLSSYESGLTLEEELENLCLGYFLVNGGLLKEAMKDTDMIEYLLEDSTIPEKDDDLGDDMDMSSGDLGDETESSMTREEAIRQEERNIASMKIDIRKLKLRISKMDKKLANKTIYSKIDGVVKSLSLGDEIDNNGIVIESEDGYYIKGTVSEMYLDEFGPGTIVKGYSYDTGITFEAEVEQVAEYPTSGESDSYFGYLGSSGNTNASSYAFTARITDETLEFSEDQWITLTFKTEQSENEELNIPKAFVRSENGLNFVYKNNNGTLEKTYVKAGSSKDGGYSVPIKGGITMNDLLAFPYGEKVKEGVKTKEGSVNDLYDESDISLY